MDQQANTTSFKTQPPQPNMATSQSKPPQKSATTKFSYLMTPEETTAHSFSPETAEETTTHSKLPPIHGLQSPPSSPATHNLPNIASATGYQVPPSPQYAYQNNYVTGYGSTSPPSFPAPAFGDATLFASESERAHPHSPLFGQEQQQQQRQQQRQRTASPRISSIDRPAPPPAPARDGFSLNYPCHLDIRTPSQAESYWRGCCESLDKMRHLPAPLNTVSATRDPLSVSQLRSIERSNAVVARQQQPRTTVPRSHRVTKSTAASSSHATLAVQANDRKQHVRRASRQQKAAAASPAASTTTRPVVVATPPPRQQQQTLANGSNSTTRYTTHSSRSPDLTNGSANNNNKVTKHRRAPASKPRPAAENWYEIEDYCPPLSTLDNKQATPKPLKARAVGTSGPLDLSKDPDAHRLHPDELQVASVLRLQCAKYLLNKRKIFKAKFELLKDQQEKALEQQQGNGGAVGGAAGGGRVGTPGAAHHGAAGSAGNFNKTEAQKACTIDVNKASSLFQAFEEVGWLRREWFEEHLKRYFEEKAAAEAAEAAN